MAKMKPNKKYYFTVDGETEQWYLKWLQSQINNEKTAKYNVSFICDIRDPLKYAKSLTVFKETVITHICDYESDEEVHTIKFRKTLDLMKNPSR
jgi:methylaspartate ammonia-lyase